jgi:hypothetical protein
VFIPSQLLCCIQLPTIVPSVVGHMTVKGSPKIESRTCTLLTVVSFVGTWEGDPAAGFQPCMTTGIRKVKSKIHYHHPLSPFCRRITPISKFGCTKTVTVLQLFRARLTSLSMRGLPCPIVHDGTNFRGVSCSMSRLVGRYTSSTAVYPPSIAWANFPTQCSPCFSCSTGNYLGCNVGCGLQEVQYDRYLWQRLRSAYRLAQRIYQPYSLGTGMPRAIPFFELSPIKKQ